MAADDPIEAIHQNFLGRLTAGRLPRASAGMTPAEAGLDAAALVEMFRSQVLSRHLDLRARQLQAAGQGFYTIGSAGHEASAAVAAAFRPDDMAFLHYRDAAFVIQRASQVGGQDPAWDLLLGFVASSEDPISGGRHKVLGSQRLAIPPQTSTIASHLPKAVGAAYAIGLARRLGLDGVLARDAVILCSFGDASINHSSAQGAFNTAAWSAYQNVPLPLVFVCEDNGLGISTRTPPGWVMRAMGARPDIAYMACDGLDILDTYRVSCAAERHARAERRPVFLHMRCVRLFGHAGSDAESAYLSRNEIAAQEANDPLLHTARLLIENAILDAGEVRDIYSETGERTARLAARALGRPKLATVAEVKSSVVPPKRRAGPTAPPSPAARAALFRRESALMAKPQHMARLINWTLADLMLAHPEIVLAGEDIGPKGGVYNVTSKLHERFGPARVINTLLDEQSILGLAIGLAHNGLLPIPEIQFLAYLHNAEDQLRGEAATLSFFSNGQYTNPMVIRIAGLGYQRGFGGHFHNDNSVAVLRDIPGLVVACPSNGADAIEMLRECVRLAREEQRVVVFLEPIALYMMRDLHAPGDGLWTFPYRPPDGKRHMALGEPGHFGDATELCILTYGNGYYLSRQAAHVLQAEHGVAPRVVDIRWLAPLDAMRIIEAAGSCDHVLIVDECRATGSQSEALVTLLMEHARGTAPKLARLAAEDCFIPLGPAATVPLPSRDAIVAAALSLLGATHRPGRDRSSAS